MTDVFQPDWEAWEAIIDNQGIELDRPVGSLHPVHSEIVYPIDYGFVVGTRGTDGDELDIFVGTAANGLVGAIMTTDRRKGDRECKLLFNCSRAEVYLVNGFINYDRSKMHGDLLMRWPLHLIDENR